MSGSRHSVQPWLIRRRWRGGSYESYSDDTFVQLPPTGGDLDYRCGGGFDSGLRSNFADSESSCRVTA